MVRPPPLQEASSKPLPLREVHLLICSSAHLLIQPEAASANQSPSGRTGSSSGKETKGESLEQESRGGSGWRWLALAGGWFRFGFLVSSPSGRTGSSSGKGTKGETPEQDSPSRFLYVLAPLAQLLWPGLSRYERRPPVTRPHSNTSTLHQADPYIYPAPLLYPYGAASPVTRGLLQASPVTRGVLP